MTDAKETPGQIEYHARGLKAPRIRASALRLAGQARGAGRTHGEYLAAVLSREVAARKASGAETRASARGISRQEVTSGFQLRPPGRPQARDRRAPGHRRVPGRGLQR